MKFKSLLRKKGDDGYTDLFIGGRVKKTDPRIKVLGAIDKLNARMGLIRKQAEIENSDNALTDFIFFINFVQDKLVYLMGELACDSDSIKEYKEIKTCISSEDMDYIDGIAESLAEWLDNNGYKLDGWTKYGDDSLFIAELDILTTEVRECEIDLISLSEIYTLRHELLHFFNRLSKVLFLLRHKIAFTTKKLS